MLLPKDYVRFCLSGEYAIDVAEASGTLMLDVAHRCWSQELLGQVDLDAALLPRVFESPEICARVTADAALLTGLVAGTPIVAGAEIRRRAQLAWGLPAREL